MWADYFERWISLNKKGAVSPHTLGKYYLSLKHLRKYCPTKELNGLTRQDVQQFINLFAQSHEKATVKDLYHQISACLKDAHYEGYMQKDPTYKIVIKGKKPAAKKKKYLEVDEASELIKAMRLEAKETRSPLGFMCEFILRTGLRFEEALGLTPADIDHEKRTVTINKAFNYKPGKHTFVPTKNKTSMRTIMLDQDAYQIICYFAQRCESDNTPIWVDAYYNYSLLKAGSRAKDRQYTMFVSTVNYYLSKRCKEAQIPIISVHGLRHTHASILIAAGVSIQSVAQRLGHADTRTTQVIYIHLLQKLKAKDEKKIDSALEGLGQ